MRNRRAHNEGVQDKYQGCRQMEGGKKARGSPRRRRDEAAGTEDAMAGAAAGHRHERGARLPRTEPYFTNSISR